MGPLLAFSLLLLFHLCPFLRFSAVLLSRKFHCLVSFPEGGFSDSLYVSVSQIYTCTLGKTARGRSKEATIPTGFEAADCVNENTGSAARLEALGDAWPGPHHFSVAQCLQL